MVGCTGVWNKQEGNHGRSSVETLQVSDSDFKMKKHSKKCWTLITNVKFAVEIKGAEVAVKQLNVSPVLLYY